MKALLDLLRDPSLVGLDVDGPARLELHAAMLARKRMLREVFSEFHRLCRRLDQRLLQADGLSVELGAGIAPIRDTYPDVLATDVIASFHLDRVIDAEAMAFSDGSVRVLFGLNCFHHFPRPDRFFAEAARVLAPGGGVILLEPYHGPFASLLFKRLFRTEGFDKLYPSWETPASGPMQGANQALSYIVFSRDRIAFERKHPSLKLVHQQRVDNYLKYLLSGGLNFRQLVPDAASSLVDLLQAGLSPLNRWLALHHVIVLRKEPV